MKLHFGAIPESHDFRPDDQWLSLREPDPTRATLFSIPIAIVMYQIVGDFWATSNHVTKAEVLFPFTIPKTALIILLLILVHELLHAAVQPGFPKSRRCTIGIWPSRLAFYCHFDGPITRNRFLVCLLTPLVVLTIFPILLVAVTGIQSRALAMISTINGMSAAMDILGAWLVFRHIPNNSIVRNQGWKTFWRKKKNNCAGEVDQPSRRLPDEA